MKSSTGSFWINEDINFIRVKKPSSHFTKVVHLLLLFTGLSSCNETSTSPPHVTSAQTSVYYLLDIAIDVTGPAKNESEITSWFQEVFQNTLGSCVSSHAEYTTTFPLLVQQTSANSSLGTTNGTQSNIAITASTLPSDNTTLAFQNTNTATTTFQNSETATALQTFGTTTTIMFQNPNKTGANNTAERPNNTAAKNATNNAGKKVEKTIPNSKNARFIRTAVLSSKSSGIFQGLEVSCAEKTKIRKTNCLAILALRQNVSPCCILKTICTANQNSSQIHATGKRANRQSPPNENCNSDHMDENICIYEKESNNSKCDDSAFGAAPCGPEKNKNCSCAAFCNATDAYYTFEISIQDPEMNGSYVLLLMTQLNQSCSPTTNESCSFPTIASEYKNATVECSPAGTNSQSCNVFLHLAEAVPVCNVSAAITTVFQSEKNITFDGRTTRAAICGHPKFSDNLLDSQFTWTNTTYQHADVCPAEEGSPFLLTTQNCQPGKNMVVPLKEQCVPIVSSTAGPNVTVSSNTASSPDVTTVSSNESRANALLELTANVSRLNSSQVEQLVSQLEDLLSGPNISVALANITIYIVSNLLDASAETLASSSDRIIGLVDTVGLKLVLEEATETLLSPALALSVKAVDGNDFQQVLFSISDPNNAQVRADRRFQRSERNNSSIPQGSITLPPSLTQNLTSEEQQMASRVHFNFYQKSTLFQDSSLGTRRLNSGILGASLANLTVTGLEEEIVISLRNLESIPANYVATCVFWDFALNGQSGGWNTNGCTVRNSTDDVTVCGCNHLTSFSILLDLARQPLTSRVNATVLSFITYIGCGISAIFLSLTLLTYLAFGKLRKDIPSKILIQLCVALLLLNLVFLVDAWLALYPDAAGLCISTAWFLHYFLLAAFTWMGLEGVHLYLGLVKVFNTHVPRYILWFSLAGWGAPVIVVIIVIAVDKDNYGLVSYGRFSDGTSDDFCWLKNDIAFYVAVVGYFCVIFLFNFIILVVVLVQLQKMKKQNPHNSQHRTTGQDVRSVVGLTILLGLSWGFAFFAWGPVNLPFMYLFAICNAFQGLYIFVFHCAVKETVRRQWQTYLCFGKMRMAENSERSRTATQKIMKRASVTRPSSRSNTSSSSTSFLSRNSEQIHGIGNPLDDRIITIDEEPSVDVILNE
ncbi:adhesion G-protein coupled receptor G2 [Syngnathus acus]|uniref:adhesion G-protein coupled receptor G2 n=1 Tax=Syngnathus acus TaxID=161584 RepID=UPI0018864FB7|nr:adhesion G-protein coupled receptor G2 [Syngnathus acus]